VQDQSSGVLDTIAQSVEADGLDPGRVGYFVHGGTTVINAITERKGVKTALVTTRGFRDVLEIGRGNRPDLYNLRFRSPAPYVERHLRLEVSERMDTDGKVLEAIALDEILAIAQTLRDAGAEAVAILFLNSYANPEHEIACAHKLAELLPDVTICASHEVTGLWREYERSNTVVLNAYVKPIISTYFQKLEAKLIAASVKCAHYAMLSNGGVGSFLQASEAPLNLVESGPSGGIAGAARIGELLDEPNILALDVGGTTAKCSVIIGGKPRVFADYKMEWDRHNPGYPVQVPVVDIVEIGAGGGSIARVDVFGALTVGPDSAGADPGPVCYGQGGIEPTVTDAKLLTGVIRHRQSLMVDEPPTNIAATAP
jgi:N-methylhydantoinase A